MKNSNDAKSMTKSMEEKFDGNHENKAEPKSETVPQESNAIKIGVVSDCLRLNVRKEPKRDSEVICEIEDLSEVMIKDENESNEFYKICTATGIEGFCMKRYITIPE